MTDIQKLYEIFNAHPVICTDTRKITPGCLFFALKGDNFNGNTFAGAAISQGARLAVVDEKVFKTGENFFLVKDVLETLQQLALYHRRQLDIPFIAITGSNGKTTTKELVSAVLASKYETAFTRGNLNNHIGVPLTLLSVTKMHEMVVIEMGANHLREIDLLCRLAEPTHGMITNIGKAHLEGFGGLEGVKKGKGELYEFLKKNNGTVFINPDQQSLVELLEDYPNTISYGTGPQYDICGEATGKGAFLEVEWRKKNSDRSYHIKTNLAGSYNLPNVLAAACIGDFFGVKPDKICSVAGHYTPGNQRSQVVQKGSNVIVLDAYNANPSSMEAALKNFNENYGNDKMVVIGDMLELGEESESEHEAIAMLIAGMNFREVVLVGGNFGKCARKLKCRYFQNADEARDWIREAHVTNTAVLIKGSRGLMMEKTLEAF